MRNLTVDDTSPEQENDAKFYINDKTTNKSEQKIDEIKNIMKNNIEKMMFRGVNLTDLKDSCDHLEAQAAQFQVITRKVRRKMYFKSKKRKIIIIVLITFLLLIFMIGFFIFYFFFLRTKI